MTTSHRSARRCAGLAMACVGTIAACTSGGSTPANESAAATALPPLISESVILQSADGVVSLEVPAGSVREGTDLGIDLVDPSEVAGLEGTSPIGSAYRLRPEGLSFPDPLIVTFRLQPDETDPLPLVLVMVDVGGELGAEPEGRTSVSPEGEIEHLSSVFRFGTMVLIDSGLSFGLDPQQLFDLELGQTFEATLTTSADHAVLEPWPAYDIVARWQASGATSGPPLSTEATMVEFGADRSAPPWVVVGDYRCDVIGSGLHAAELSVAVGGLPGGNETRQFALVIGESSCGDVGRSGT